MPRHSVRLGARELLGQARDRGSWVSWDVPVEQVRPIDERYDSLAAG